MRRAAGALLVLLLVSGTAGCGTLGYLAQAGYGQLRVLAAREPVERLLADPRTAPELAARLRLVEQARAFAADELALPVGGRYRHYAATGREFVVWNVFAAPPLSVEPVTWCFPIAGCVAYRGYFSHAGAQRFAERQARAGLDVWIGGVDAYSTLGWFDDPVLDTFIDRPPVALVGLLFHELAHGRVYLPGDTAFNESYATVVELAGLRRWASARPELAHDWQQYREQLALRERFSAFVLEARVLLAERYAAAPRNADPQSVRAAAFAQVRAAYRARRDELGGGRFDGWFATPNNARLVPFLAYWNHVPALTALLADSASMAAFHAAVERLAQLDTAAREDALATLAGRVQASIR